MNLKTIKLLPSSLSVQICIGRMGEHGVTEVDFDLSEFENTYGSGTPELLFRPKNSSESYPVPLINDGGSNYKWIVNLPTTAKSGSHVATMRWYVGEELAKSCDIQCHVESVSDVVVGDMPDPVKDWLDKLMNNLPAGGVTPDQIHRLIAEYMTRNPIETLTEEDIKAIVESYGYLTEDSDTIYDDAEIREMLGNVYTKEESDAKTLEFGQSVLSEIVNMLSVYATKDEIPEPFDDTAMRSEMVSLENAYREANSNVMQLYNTVVEDKKDKIIGTYGSSISNRVYEVIGIPEYIGEDEIGTVNGFNITTTGWYAFARITADNGVYVGSSLIVDGVEDYRAGVNHLDVAVRFGTNGESREITVNWNGSVTNTYLISASDLAIRNLDYRSTYRVYDIGDCLSFTTSGTKKAVFQNLTRNIVYAVDAINCPMVVYLPDVSTESFGTWIELRVELTTSTGVSLEFIPPEGTKLSGTNVNVPKEGLNIIMAQYHEKMNTWFISNTVWAKPK